MVVVVFSFFSMWNNRTSYSFMLEKGTLVSEDIKDGFVPIKQD